MPFLRPVPMVKVGFVGLKDDRERILSLLHDLGAVQVEPLGKESLQYLDPERASDVQRAVADQLLRFRGLVAALPPAGPTAPRPFADRAELERVSQSVPVDDEVGRLKREEDQLLTERKSVQDMVDLLDRFSFYRDRLEYLAARSVYAYFGEGPPETVAKLREELAGLGDSEFVAQPMDKRVRFLLAVPTAQAETVARLAQQQGVSLTAVPKLAGTPAEERPKLVSRRGEIDARLAAIRQRLASISGQWYPTVAALEEAWAIENRKFDVYTRLGAGRTTFALEGWVPKRERARLESALAQSSAGRVLVYDLPTHEEPPTYMENPRGIRRYEFFIRFYSLPQATEWDPTWVFAIVFPIFFGLMLGDWGYGLVILLISLWMIRGFPGAKYLPKKGKNFVKLIMGPKGMQSLAYAIVPGTILAIVLGFLFNEFFGYQVLPYGTVIDPFKSIPTLLLTAGYVGLGMVCFGFGLGALKEYFHHHVRGALGKLGGIFFAVGIADYGLGVLHVHGLFPGLAPLYVAAYALLGGGVILIFAGEGIQTAIMTLLEVVSHILSYTRLIGILLASVVLAIVIIKLSNIVQTSLPFPVGILVAAVILVGGQAFNVILGVFEPGIQGARLIFVEYFSKFYSGNGKPFQPFRTERTHTVAAAAPSGFIRGGESPTTP